MSALLLLLWLCAITDAAILPPRSNLSSSPDESPRTFTGEVGVEISAFKVHNDPNYSILLPTDSLLMNAVKLMSETALQNSEAVIIRPFSFQQPEWADVRIVVTPDSIGSLKNQHILWGIKQALYRYASQNSAIEAKFFQLVSVLEYNGRRLGQIEFIKTEGSAPGTGPTPSTFTFTDDPNNPSALGEPANSSITEISKRAQRQVSIQLNQLHGSRPLFHVEALFGLIMALEVVGQSEKVTSRNCLFTAVTSHGSWHYFSTQLSIKPTSIWPCQWQMTDRIFAILSWHIAKWILNGGTFAGYQGTVSIDGVKRATITGKHWK